MFRDPRLGFSEQRSRAKSRAICDKLITDSVRVVITVESVAGPSMLRVQQA